MGCVSAMSAFGVYEEDELAAMLDSPSKNFMKDYKVFATGDG